MRKKTKPKSLLGRLDRIKKVVFKNKKKLPRKKLFVLASILVVLFLVTGLVWPGFLRTRGAVPSINKII